MLYPQSRPPLCPNKKEIHVIASKLRAALADLSPILCCRNTDLTRAHSRRADLAQQPGSRLMPQPPTCIVAASALPTGCFESHRHTLIRVVKDQNLRGHPHFATVLPALCQALARVEQLKKQLEQLKVTGRKLKRRAPGAFWAMGNDRAYRRLEKMKATPKNEGESGDCTTRSLNYNAARLA